jgi:hypothetical protein
MDTSLTESRDRLQQAIDDEINLWQESTRALRARRNALAPISRLSPETLAAIFSYFPSSTWKKEPRYLTQTERSSYFPCIREGGRLAWIAITHVCRRWRETALSHPHLWSRMSFTSPTPACIAELFTRAKTAPLHLEANATDWSEAQFYAFGMQLEANISHTRHLKFCGPLQPILERLVSSAPTLEFLSLSHKSSLLTRLIIPVNLFNCTAPSLTSLKLKSCDISWKSPLLKGLQTLEIHWPSTEARPALEDWLGALKKMPQLKTLILKSATPLALSAPLTSEPSHTVTLPFLIKFHVSASAKDCVLALAHLVLPALTWLHVDAESHEGDGEDVRLLIPYVSRNVCRLQGTEPLRSIAIYCKRTRAELAAWSMADADVKFYGLEGGSLGNDNSVPARLMFATKGSNWDYEVNTAIIDALLTHLPMNSVSTLTVKNRTELSKEFWLSHAPRWPLLKQIRLVPTAVKGFRAMLAGDTPFDGPRLPSLTKLILAAVTLTAPRTFDLRDMLIERLEQGVPLEVLDLFQCYAADCAIKLLREVVVVVTGPFYENKIREDPAFSSFKSGGGTGYEVEYCDVQPWYGYLGCESEGEYYDLFGYYDY